MNRYPLWKYLVILVTLVLAIIYAIPNLFGDAPIVQISSAKQTLKIDEGVKTEAEKLLQTKQIPFTKSSMDHRAIRLQFANEDLQKQAQQVLETGLNTDPADPNYTASLNLASLTPDWLQGIGALPMYKGLDLRGGIHLTMQVDMEAAQETNLESIRSDMRSSFRKERIRYVGSVKRDGLVSTAWFNTEADAEKAAALMREKSNDFDVQTLPVSEGKYPITVQLKPEAITALQERVLKQNITTLNNRVNELGVSEPIIQQQGKDRIVVQLAGVQDMNRVQQILGRIATLELRMVDESPAGLSAERGLGNVPFGSEKYYMAGDLEKTQPVIVYKDVVLTGENLTNAKMGRDRDQKPSVDLTLDSKGATIFKEVTRANVNKRMAILLFEKGKGEVVTAPVIKSEIGGGNVQISGQMTAAEAADTALLLRAGSLAAPMEIIEQRTIGPSLGKENIEKGFDSVVYGFIAVAIFMCVYYMLFGTFSTLALGFNLLLLVAALSLLQATLTLPGMAAMALVLGMAIDANVLINERIREELRAGRTPQMAIHEGYSRAWDTIIDSNITSLLAGIALFVFGSGPVRGFAVVHCLGILTSMFSAVVFSRGLVNLWYGRKRKLQNVSIGTVWKPE